MFYILIVVVIIWINTFAKIYRIICLKLMHFVYVHTILWIITTMWCEVHLFSGQT